MSPPPSIHSREESSHSSPTPPSDPQKRSTSNPHGPWHRGLYAVCLAIDRCKTPSHGEDYKWSKTNRCSSLEWVGEKIPFLARDRTGLSLPKPFTAEQFQSRMQASFRPSRSKAPEGCTSETFWSRGSENFEQAYFSRMKHNAMHYDAAGAEQLLPRFIESLETMIVDITTPDATRRLSVIGHNSSDDDELSSIDSFEEPMLDNGSVPRPDEASPRSSTSDPSPPEPLPESRMLTDEHPRKRRKLEHIPRRISSESVGDGIFDGPGERTFDLDAGKIKAAMNDISQLIQSAVAGFMSDIRLSIGQASLYSRCLDAGLVALFHTSFSVDIRATYETLQSLNKLQAYDVLRSLVSAFLYSNIFDGGLDWQQELCQEVVQAERKAKHGSSWKVGTWQTLADK
ncbi:hypothetical protein CLAFUW4_06728 [Fulvia fulva]|uniref:Uncharacterized protein n=1 Tax=Passalora fulva TaxID=5499 RepID=A0A9Q8PBU5_PASFU|nr:uncharacterized protein CLAFUR5_06871 [Fulvia fulva]KAK4621209.1 hypothetical protein CLAFUR4_06736 [Fulvia fulva]KAK4623128.1 hypothetical protein CLAFUR0_06731 [Fulvia fulva]UJO19532.1 hypothetical protein CLAFUR5_06871 [Fulvia fulva]WPV16292.1 hypothetical protein CLAFUW4_06728 [Fulvia fulva]WPV31052.1 hypothetical protein CLAFUW7_06727 [Fulvia fulva]